MRVNTKTQEWAARQPRKLVASKVIIRSTEGNVLLVKPNYKPGWQFPGGGVEAGESPVEAAVRELREELGLDIPITDLEFVDMVFRPDLDNLLLVFERRLPIDEATKMQVQLAELEDYQYVKPSEVAPLISDYYTNLWQAYLKPAEA